MNRMNAGPDPSGYPASWDRPDPSDFGIDPPGTPVDRRYTPDAIDAHRRVRTNHVAACIDPDNGVIECQCGTGSPGAF